MKPYVIELVRAHYRAPKYYRGLRRTKYGRVPMCVRPIASAKGYATLLEARDDAQAITRTWGIKCVIVERVVAVKPAPEEGVDRCACGCKYWDGGVCHSCGEKFVGVTA